MNETREAVSTLLSWAWDHSELLVVAGLGLTVLLLAWTVRKAVTSGRPDTWLARLSLLVGFGWSGEAMWEVATQKLHLSPVFAGFAFFLFETQMATAMLRAERHHNRHKHPGKHGRAVWLIAGVAGVIAAMAGDSPVEVGLRLAVPLMVAHQWWVGLTDDAHRPADAITWTWTPRRILVALGLAKPGEQDLETVDRERHIRAIATVSHRLHSTSWRWRRSWLQARLRRLAMNADDEMLDAARVRVERVWQAADRTRPVDTADRSRVAVAAGEAAQAEADAARAAQAEAVALAHAAAAHAEAEAARRSDLEAEVQTLRAQVETEGTDRAKAQADADAARAQARAEALRAARVQGQADAAAQQWQRQVVAAQTAAAKATQALTDEQRRRQTAETDARTQAEAYAAAVRQLDELRERLTQAEAHTARRSRRAPTPNGKPLMFDGAPVPDVPGVGASTVLAVLQARKAHPDDTQKQLADRVRVTDRTVRSVLAAASDRDLAVTTS